MLRQLKINFILAEDDYNRLVDLTNRHNAWARQALIDDPHPLLPYRDMQPEEFLRTLAHQALIQEYEATQARDALLMKVGG